jgi:hypothetical protein
MNEEKIDWVEVSKTAIKGFLFGLFIGILVVWMLSGCTPVIQTEYVQTQLHRDPPPIFTKINSSGIPNCSVNQTPCITKDTAQKLLTREQQFIAYCKYLMALIDSTSPEPLNAAQPPKN